MTGYIQLELGGKKRGVKFGNYALMEYSKLNGTGVAEVTEPNPIILCADLLYCGLKNNCFIKREVEDFTREDVLMWVDEMPMDKITEIILAFQESVTLSNSVIEINQAISIPDKTNSSKPKK